MSEELIAQCQTLIGAALALTIVVLVWDSLMQL